MELLISIATILALALAIWQTRSAYVHTKTLKAIAGHVSTKSLSEFPEYISELPALIKSTEKHLDIVCDAPSIAIFSNYCLWKEYRRSIIDLHDNNPKVKITLTILEVDLARKHISDQFSDITQDYSKWKANPENQSKVLKVLDQTLVDEEYDYDELTIEELTEVFLKVDEIELKTTFKNAIVHRVKYPMSSYYWISDEREAIFAIPRFGKGSVTEHGFRTNDEALIRSFRSITNRYHTGLDYLISHENSN